MIRTRRFALAALAMAPALTAALPALAADVTVDGAYALSSNPKVGAIFMTLRNQADAPATLVAVRSPAAKSPELHTHIMEDGIAKMRPMESLEIPAMGEATLARGGDHVMLMGLVEPLSDGDHVPLTLIFDDGDEVEVDVIVDNAHQPGAMKMDHSGHGDMKMKPASD